MIKFFFVGLHSYRSFGSTSFAHTPTFSSQSTELLNAKKLYYYYWLLFMKKICSNQKEWETKKYLNQNET